jgi:hypothetical protein
VCEREVVLGEVDLEADDVRRQDPERLFEQFLARVVALEHGDGLQFHLAAA